VLPVRYELNVYICYVEESRPPLCLLRLVTGFPLQINITSSTSCLSHFSLPWQCIRSCTGRTQILAGGSLLCSVQTQVGEPKVIIMRSETVCLSNNSDVEVIGSLCAFPTCRLLVFLSLSLLFASANEISS
jgi:hypothetical protein